MQKFTIVIHGGAGTISRDKLSADGEKQYRDGLNEAIQAGYFLLENGYSALEAVQKATMVLEDNILFNAGRGSVFNAEGTHEMDAAIMDGATLMAGSVAGIQNIRNPIALAADVMQHSGHVMLCGKGANDFAAFRGFAYEPESYFFSAHRFEQWQAAKENDQVILDHSMINNPANPGKFGTVGAVACDRQGNLAAATSTGGMTNKKFGRVGDSPLIGAGTYANNETCAISCTGHGEPFIRAVAAYDVSALMEYSGISIEKAMEKVVFEKLKNLAGEGGMIGVNREGDTALVFNSEGMYRAFKSSDGKEFTGIYK